jgi:4-diphosphocytidyl-2-C-methyl-D-erythritol kinase
MKISYSPNAKINIGLYVVEKRPDGYHNLQTVFYPLPVVDELIVEEKSSLPSAYSLEVEGVQVTSLAEDNLIIKAYRLLEKDFSLGKTSIYLKKQIPFGAGLGGGSSDAAYMLKALNELYELGLTEESLEGYAVQLGADCPFFIRNQPVYATGIGNIFTPISLSLKGMQFVLVKPDIHVSTSFAYSDVRPCQPEYSLQESILLPVEQWKDRIKNDFEASVFKHHPSIAAYKQFMYQSGASYAAMSGSGSSVFGIFPAQQALPSFPGELISFAGEF